jgi:hypothetical protein
MWCHAGRGATNHTHARTTMQVLLLLAPVVLLLPTAATAATPPPPRSHADARAQVGLLRASSRGRGSTWPRHKETHPHARTPTQVLSLLSQGHDNYNQGELGPAVQEMIVSGVLPRDQLAAQSFVMGQGTWEVRVCVCVLRYAPGEPLCHKTQMLGAAVCVCVCVCVLTCVLSLSLSRARACVRRATSACRSSGQK